MRKRLVGNSASLKFAFRVARNVAREELRRCRHDRLVNLDVLEDLPEGRYEPDPPDPALRQAIRECLDRLPTKPRNAMKARVQAGAQLDRDLAAGLRMKVNTFLQNIVRARRLLRDCLGQRGVRIEEMMS